jgi:predicted DNA-binding transcriptional regulator YafY
MPKKSSPKPSPANAAPAAGVNRPALARMMKIHAALNRGSRRPINCSSLAEDLGYDEKTVQRDVNYMRKDLALPIRYDFGRRSYYYDEGTEVPFPIGHQLTEDERIALSVARQSLEVFRGCDFGARLASAHDKLYGGILSENGLTLEGTLSDYISTRVPGAGIADAKVFKGVLGALLKHCELRVDYQAKGRPKPTPRRLAPYHLACVASRWVLVARDLEKDEIRTYILARMSNPRWSVDEPITRPPEFDPTSYIGTSFGVWTGRGETVVKIRISSEGAHHVIERHWHDTQKVTPLPGGAVEVTFKLSDLNDVTRWILGFGGDIEVLEPRELRATVAEEGRRMAARNA